MKPIALLILKTFLLTGFGFALFMGLIDLIFDGSADPGKFLYRLIAFGGLMSILFVAMQFYGVKLLGLKSFTTENLGVKQKRIVLSNLSMQDILRKIKTDPGLKKMKATEEVNSILLSSNISWMSWGEKISIQPLHSSGTKTEYEIISRPKLSTTIMDGGKNLENVMRVEKLIG